jgi:sugar phosphate isomerase/epimerase
LLRRLGDRVHAVHVKDGPLRPGISARQLPTDQQPAGHGDVPLAAALAAADNLALAVVEFDHYEGDIFDGVAESFAFLSRQTTQA